jgi:ornithine--oxo-acid transaminase
MTPVVDSTTRSEPAAAAASPPSTASPASSASGTHLAPNYAPLPVTLASGEGARLTDTAGRVYLDLLAGYSALNFGHRHPRLVDAAQAQLGRLTLTSRAFRSDQLGPFADALAALCDMDLVLPMNTGAEAVETAIKVARKWGYRVKGVPEGQATIVVAENNFHGRTTTIISFSTDKDARDDFGPYTPGFRVVRYVDLAALQEAIDETTVAVLLEPIQGEAGVYVPPAGYTVRYVIHRLCEAAGDPSNDPAVSVTCMRSSAVGGSTSTSTKGVSSYSSYSVSEKVAAIYRITVQVTGPRNTRSYIQATVN